MSEIYGSHRVDRMVPSDDALFNLVPEPVTPLLSSEAIPSTSKTADSEPREGAWQDLGGQRHALTIDEERAIVAANAGNRAMRADVRRADDAKKRERDLNLSGDVVRTPEQEAALQALVQQTHNAVDARRIAEGADPTLVAARRRALEARRDQ